MPTKKAAFRSEMKTHKSELSQLLAEKLPSEYKRYDLADATAIAKAGNLEPYSVRRWLIDNKMSVRGMKLLATISANAEDPAEKGMLTEQDLLPFLHG